MFRKRILNYFDKRLSGIESNYRSALEGTNPEAVHDLRVHLKRTRALFDLVESLTPDFRARREFKRFRRIARCTRRLRDIQVQSALLERSTRHRRGLPEGYRDFLARLESESLRKFLDTPPPEFGLELAACRERLAIALEGLNEEASLARAEARYHGLKADTLELACRGAAEDAALHALRTLSKQTHYTFEIVNGGLGRLRPEKEFIRRLKKLHALLGDWHDREVAFDYLDKFLRQVGSRALDSGCGRLAEIFRREKDALTRRCRAEIARLQALLVTPGQAAVLPPVAPDEPDTASRVESPTEPAPQVLPG